LGDTARDLAYLLYTTCDRKGWAQEAGPYNALVTAWPELTRLASQAGTAGSGQRDLFGGKEGA
jgi:putative DNA methylase